MNVAVSMHTRTLTRLILDIDSVIDQELLFARSSLGSRRLPTSNPLLRRYYSSFKRFVHRVSGELFLDVHLQLRYVIESWSFDHHDIHSIQAACIMSVVHDSRPGLAANVDAQTGSRNLAT